MARLIQQLLTRCRALTGAWIETLGHHNAYPIRRTVLSRPHGRVD